VNKICDFWPISRCRPRPISVKCEIMPRLLLITNRKSYTGSRLASNSMTLNVKIRGFMDFLAISQCGAMELSLGLCDPNREFGRPICILTSREHPNFQLNY